MMTRPPSGFSRRVLLRLTGGAATGIATGAANGVPTGSALGGEGSDSAAEPFWPGAEGGRGVPAVRLWTTETWPERIAVIRYLMDVYSALAGLPPVIFESFSETRVLDVMRAAQRPGSRIPMPHVINTGADALMAMDAEGLLSGDGGRVVESLGPESFEPGALAAVRRPDGQVSAVPFHGSPQVIWCRRDWLRDEHDLAPPTSLDDVLVAAQRLYAPDRGRRGVILGNSGDFYTQQCFLMVARAVGASVFAADASLALNTPEMAEALDVYAALARFSGPGLLTWRARDYYLQHRAGMLFYSTFLMDDLAVASLAADSLTGDYFDDLDGTAFDRHLVDHTAPVFLLSGRTPQDMGAFTSINGLGLTGTGNHKDRVAARNLVRFLFRRDAYIAWLHMAPGGMIPVVRGVLDDDAFMRDRLGVFQTFGRAVTRRLGEALRLPSTFSAVTDGDRSHADPRAGRLYAASVVGRMVARRLQGEQSAAESARVAQEDALRLLSRDFGRPPP